VHPVISEEAATDLISAYVAMRRMGGSKRIITATPRQLESLIRLSEAHARMRLSAEVEPADVAEAVRLMKVATQSAATDPTTGTIDMDLITTGRSAASRTMTQQLAALLREKFAQMRSQSLPVADVHRALQQDSGLTVSTTELREALGELQRENASAARRRPRHPTPPSTLPRRRAAARSLPGDSPPARGRRHRPVSELWAGWAYSAKMGGAGVRGRGAGRAAMNNGTKTAFFRPHSRM